MRCVRTKRNFITALITLFCVSLLCALFCGCGEKVGRVDPKEEKLQAGEPTAPENILPETDFVGTYSNGDYTVTVIQDDDEQLRFTVSSDIKNGQSSEWKMSGYFSGETCRVNYTDAVKVTTYYYSGGGVKSVVTEYEDGAGRMQFGADGTLAWDNSMEKLDGSNKLSKVG